MTLSSTSTAPVIVPEITTNNATTIKEITVVRGGQEQTSPTLIYWILGVGIVAIGFILYATRNKVKEEHDADYDYHR